MTTTSSSCGYRSISLFAVLIAALTFGSVGSAADDTVFAEHDGLVAVEAEHFASQSKSDVRAFHITTADKTPDIAPDGDPNHVAGASSGAYLEILPDTRRTHDDKLIRGTNFSPEPGKMAVVSYKVSFKTPGRYYVWVRAYSTGSEDNGLHVGIDGTWPASGQRLQWCQGKQSWRWESKQRTSKNHCGEAGKIFIDVDDAGIHEIAFSMREDGFEFDKWIMTTDDQFQRPEGTGPDVVVASGPKPTTYAYVEPSNEPQRTPAQPETTKRAALTMPAKMFAEAKLTGYYLDKGKWLAVDPNKNKTGKAARTFPYPTGKYHVTVRMVGENDGSATYTLSIDDDQLGEFTCPLASETYDEGPKYRKRFENVAITEGAIISVTSTIGSKDGQEFSRARWSSVAFEPADAETYAAAADVIRKSLSATRDRLSLDRSTSPTKSTSDMPLQEPRQPHGDGSVAVSGELKTWHKVTLDLAGPYAHEKDNEPNPFTDYAMTVRFVHEDGTRYVIPGYFAADGDAANTSAESGTVWRAHFAPDRTGTWQYAITFRSGKFSALDPSASSDALAPFDGVTGTIKVAATGKTGRDLRAHGRLQYVGERYLKFAGTGQYFLKVGADAPETLLAYADFDNTIANKLPKAPLKTWKPHLKDWADGDPTWADGKGKGLIGAINYLSGKGCNAFSFLTYNAGGDGDNVWPFIQREDKLHYDCSKLDQWGVVFDHGTSKGMYLHFKMQETEMDDHNRGHGDGGQKGFVPECLDGGNLGVQRMLYCRELIARFGHNLALNWNLGEENTQTTEQLQAMIDYIAGVDSYDHPIVVHTFPNQQDKVYRPLLGGRSKLTGVSLQNSSLRTTHEQTVKWVEESTKAGKPWVVAFDESGSAAHAQCPDLGYRGFDGHDRSGKYAHTQHEVRKQTLWGVLMAGGAGNEYYFGYQFDENDIVCEDWRSRDQSWDYCRIAINFFHDNAIPFWQMANADELVGNADHKPDVMCLAKPDEVYLVYLAEGGSRDLDLTSATGEFAVKWFNPRTGGDLQNGTRGAVTGGSLITIGSPPPSDAGDDWLAVIRKK